MKILSKTFINNFNGIQSDIIKHDKIKKTLNYKNAVLKIYDFPVLYLPKFFHIWVFQAVNFLDIMIEDGRSYSVYLSYSLLNFPKILNKLFPFVLFFSLFYVTIKYEANNELIIFWNFGENKIQLIKWS